MGTSLIINEQHFTKYKQKTGKRNEFLGNNLNKRDKNVYWSARAPELRATTAVCNGRAVLVAVSTIFFTIVKFPLFALVNELVFRQLCALFRGKRS